MANDPRKFTIRRPQKAGQMSAQSPDNSGRKSAILTGDLQKVKEDRASGVVFITSSESPYAVRDEDDIIVAAANVSITQVVLPGVTRPGREIVVIKSNAAAISVRITTSGLIFQAVVGSGSDKYIHDQFGAVTLRRSLFDGDWLMTAFTGTVDNIP